MPSKHSIVREVIADATGCQADLHDAKELLSVMRKAAGAVGATVLAEHCTEYQPYGTTLALMLAESHLILSTWPEHSYVTANVFLCNTEMDPETVFAVLLEHLRPTNHVSRSFRHLIGKSPSGLLGRRVFVAAPFTQTICPKERIVPYTKRVRIEMLVHALREAGASVFLAHERERWGEALMSGIDCTGLDFREMQQADAVVAVIDPPSYGVCLELGWASALQLPVVLLAESEASRRCTPLIEGLGEVTRCHIVTSTEAALRALSESPFSTTHHDTARSQLV